MKETKEAKAIRYLTTGHVKVQRHDWAYSEVHVTSDQGGDPYHVVQRGGEWNCDCPAQIPLCAHVLACMAIIPTSKGAPLLPEAHDEFASILDG